MANEKNMKFEIRGEELIIKIPIKVGPSKSGKTTIVASTGGNIITDVLHDGKPLIVGVNAYVK